MFKNQVVLITGGAGFIGSHLVDRCLKEGAEKVISFDNKSGFHIGTNNHNHLEGDPRFEMVSGDIRNYNEIEPLIRRVDLIFSEAASKLVAGLKDPLLDVQTNVLGNANILEAVRRSSNNPRVIYASTGSVFGTGDKVFDETSLKEPITAYGINKLCAEKLYLFYAKNYGIRASILRYFSVFGPRQDFRSEAGVVSIFLSRVLQGKPPLIFGNGEQTRHFTPVDHVIDANILLAQKGEAVGEDYNVAYGDEVSIIGLAKKIIEKYGPADMEPQFIAGREGDALRINPNTEKIGKLGLIPRISLEEGLDKTKEWVENELRKKG